MRLLYRLLPCPLCRRRPSSRLGCCPVCLAELFHPAVEGATLTLGAYRGRLERAVRALKYRGVTRLATPMASRLAEELLALRWPIDVICPVPLHPIRLRHRGYNQTDLIARPLSAALGLPLADLLRRVRHTAQQAQLAPEARAANVRGAFCSAPATGLTVLLVDDVLTTGATSGACRRALRAAGAQAIHLAVIARA